MLTRIPALFFTLTFTTLAFGQTTPPAAPVAPTGPTPLVTAAERPAVWFVDGPTPGTVVSLWPEGEMPGKGSDKPETRKPAQPKRDEPYAITDVSHPTLEIFKAPGATGPVPAVIVCPGGGYSVLSYRKEGTEIAAWLNSLGITAVILKYRVPNNRDGAFQDAERAVRVTREHATDWGILPDKVGMIGFSAGGHLTARLSTNFDQNAYPALDDADKLSCRPDFVMLVYPAYLDVDGKGIQLAPELRPTTAMPPTLIIHNADDHYASGSRVYDAALTAGNIPHKFMYYATGGHGYALHSQKDVRVWPTDATDWLRSIGVLPAK